MRAQERPLPHLTPDEIVARVFPVGEGAAPVPLHLAVCPECQARVAKLREAWLLDRGAVDGAIEAIPEGAWEAQAAATMARVHAEAARPPKAHPFPFPFRPVILRHPAAALGSVAAALALVAGLTFLRPQAAPVRAPERVTATTDPSALTEPGDVKDDELLRSVDQTLAEDAPFSSLVPEGAEGVS